MNDIKKKQKLQHLLNCYETNYSKNSSMSRISRTSSIKSKPRLNSQPSNKTK